VKNDVARRRLDGWDHAKGPAEAEPVATPSQPVSPA
jgi:hypothetical protein